MVFFDFEQDYTDTLRCIPMQVRFHLDACGIKLQLAEWSKMNTQERQNLAKLACLTAEEKKDYADYLIRTVKKYTGADPKPLPIDEDPSWAKIDNVPSGVKEQAQGLGLQITLEQWLQLTDLQRFALIKLSRLGHENRNFPKAMASFGLLKDKLKEQN